MENKNEISEEVRKAADTIAKWIYQNDLNMSATIVLDAVNWKNGDVSYSIHLG